MPGLVERAKASRGVLAIASATSIAAAVAASWPRSAPPSHQSASPWPDSVFVEPAFGYAGSQACASCHESEHRSWYASHHRRMTEVANESTVLAPWEERSLGLEGIRYDLWRRGQELWLRLPDPDRLAARSRQPQSKQSKQAGAPPFPPRVERQIVLTTGSHHYEAYWVRGARGNELWQVPFVYHFESQRFLPRRSLFLQPPEDPEVSVRWNSSCIQCHALAGQPRHNEFTDRFRSSVAELGVSCENCHGPAAEHARRQRARQSGDPAVEEADEAPVNPTSLSEERGAEVCGQCHAYFVPRDPERWWQSGFVETYRPGDTLASSRQLLHYPLRTGEAAPDIGQSLSSIFHPDGSVRVGGREFNGLRQSPCFERGEGERRLTCFHCHRMHDSDPNDQLSPVGGDGQVCVGCHDAARFTSSEHGHHAPDSAGSECMNCHMPFSSYALLTGIRSHRITSPRPESDAPGVPNACNLCHQDRTSRWTDEWLEQWYARTPAITASSSASSSIARVPRDLLSGNAAERILAAFNLGWSSARPAAGSDWQPLFLIEALSDPYSAVRFVAASSLRSFPAFAQIEYDFLGSSQSRAQQQFEARQRAQRARLGTQAPPRRRRALLLDGRGGLVRSEVEALIAARDETPVRIAE